MADDFLNYAFDFYLKKGYAPHQAAALAGQAQWEGQGNPAAVGDNGTAKGVFQWRLDRQGRLNARKDGNTVPGQLEFADWELSNTEKAAGDALRKSKNYEEATNAVLGFLRPQGYTPNNPMGSHGYAQRYNLGAGLINQPQMAQVLAMPPAQQVGPAPNVAEANAAPPVDPRTTGDADLGGYGGSPRIPSATANAKPFDFNGLLGAGMRQIAAGDAQAEQPAWIQAAMNSQGQVRRPQVQAGGLLAAIFPDEQRRKQMLGGLLGDM